MNLKDLSNIVKDSIQACIDSNVKLEDVEIYIGDGHCASVATKVQLRFSSDRKNGIIILDDVI